MIAKEKYLEAIKIVEDYREQLRIANVVRSKRLKEEQLKREEECGEHYYIQNGKWQSGMRCQDCGKTIDQFITHNGLNKNSIDIKEEVSKNYEKRNNTIKDRQKQRLNKQGVKHRPRFNFISQNCYRPKKEKRCVN